MIDLHCPSCGATNRPSAQFCGKCGASLTVDAHALHPGQYMHKAEYRILRRLGKGGMGVVYVAENKAAFDRLCVIKEMLDYFDGADPQQAMNAQRRFEEEGRILASLHHPGIPQIQRYFSEGGRNYIVMEYVDGTSLDEQITQGIQISVQGRLPAETVVRYGIQLCEILEYLATLNPPVVHQDIKPANIIIEKQTGRARLVDFGTAKARLVHQAGGRVGLQKSSVYGTAGYAPPEQYQGKSDVKADVYALAATLYHVLTGDDPRGHPFQFPQLSSLPLGLGVVLGQALDSDPAQRPLAHELGVRLREALERTASAAQTRVRPAATPTLGAHESYAVVAGSRLTEATRLSLANFMVRHLGMTLLEAEVHTWQQSVSIATGLDAAGATRLHALLRAEGVDAKVVLTSQVLTWRVGLPVSDKRLASKRQAVVELRALPSDRICHCYGCNHEWRTQARSFASLPQSCRTCGATNWSRHRLFQCGVCKHQFAHRDTTSPGQQLFPECPACGANDWLDHGQTQLKAHAYRVEAGRVLVGQKANAQLNLTTTGDAKYLQGRVVVKDTWLSTQSSFQGAAVGFVVDTTSLATKQTHAGYAQLICSAGVADIEIVVYVDEPPRLDIRGATLDFGLIGRHEERTLQVLLANAGGQVLQGTITNVPAWLTLNSQSFSGDETTATLSVKGSALTQAGLNSATLSVQSNGGSGIVSISVMAMPTTLVVDRDSIDLGYQPQLKRVTARVQLSNKGVGQLMGTVAATAPWLGVSPAHFDDNDVELQVVARTAGLSPEEQHMADLVISSNGGNQAVPVLVRVSPYAWLSHQLHYRKGVLFLVVFVLVCGIVTGWSGVLTAFRSAQLNARSVQAATYLADGAILYSVGRSVYLAPRSGQEHLLIQEDAQIRQMAINIDGSQVAWLRKDGAVDLWERGARSLRSLRGDLTVQVMEYLEDSKQLSVLDDQGRFGLLDLASGVFSVTGRHPGGVVLPAFSGDGRILSVVGSGGVVVYDVVKGTRMASIPVEENPTALAMNTDGSEVAWGDASGRIHQFFLDKNTLKVLAAGTVAPVRHIAYAPNQGVLAWAYDSGSVVVYAPERRMAVVSDLAARANSIGFDHDGRSLVIGTVSGLQILDIESAVSE